MTPEKGLEIAKNAFISSTSFVDSNYRKQWENNIRMYQNKHPMDSKYNSDQYKYRSKIFRPKTRAAGRKLEAAVAAAFFSNMDVVNVDAANQKDEKAIEAAKVRKELMQYRLTKTIPWFMTVIGAAQDAYTVGVVCSYQYWEYRQKKTTRQEMALDDTGVAIVDHDGQPVMNDVEDIKILKDEPCIELIPVENLRISPAAKWYDPIGTSPYIIHMIPMYVGDIKEMMETDDPKTGAPAWRTYGDTEIRSSTTHAWDPTRQARENKRQDSQQPTEDLTDFEIGWVHRNIVRYKSEDYVYYTLGIEHILSDPKPLEEVYFHKVRPYVMGVAQIETHKIYPMAPVEMGGQVQTEINEVANQRLDNVKLVLNKRYIAKRGAQVDLKSLVSNVPGSITLANDPEKDVREVDFQDVTSSSYQEHDRLNVEYDELIGNFSQGSVMTNRKLNETVGGMNMMNQGASQMSEYTIRTLTESYFEPVLQQLDALESAYETDANVMKLVGQKAEVILTPERFQDMLQEQVTFTVSVGMGATDPNQRVQKILAAINTLAQILATPIPNLNTEEVVKEVFGAIGYRDGGRFVLEGADPQQQLQQLKQMLEQCQQELQKAQMKVADKSQKDQIAAVVAKQDMQQSAQEAQMSLQQQWQQFLQDIQQQKAEFALQMTAEREKAALEREQMQREFDLKMELLKEKSEVDLETKKAESKAKVATQKAKET